MKYYQRYLKQTRLALDAHIYEHLFADFVDQALIKKGFFRLVDYTLYADTYDNIIVMNIHTSSIRLHLFVKKLFKQHLDFDDRAIDDVISQLEAEYAMKLHVDKTKVAATVQQISRQAWTDEDSWGISKKIGQINTNHLSAGKTSLDSFKYYSFVYEINDCPYELKTLATYLVQAIALNQVSLVSSLIGQAYDNGDEWAEYQDLVGYSHTFCLPKESEYDLSAMKSIELKNRSLITTDEFVRKLIRFVKSESKSTFQYFPDKSKYANSYQFVGKKYLRSIATEENVRKLLSKLKVEVAQD